MEECYILIAVETLKAAIEQTSINITTAGTNFNIFIAVSTKFLQSWKSTSYLLLIITYVVKRLVGRNARNARLKRRVQTSEPPHEFWYFYLTEFKSGFGH